MKENKFLLSLCIPTNGIIDWVLPVLDSIYEENADESLFEVVLTDNGDNAEFGAVMRDYSLKHGNLKYVKTQAFEFLNEIEAYKNASGEFIKFINHRTLLKKGTLDYFINFVRENRDEKPEVYFLNGEIKKKEIVGIYDGFDRYVKELSYYSSWSTGMGFWKENFDKIERYDDFNLLFPHTNVLFFNRRAKKYIIDNTPLLKELPVGKIPKGRYNLFNAFAVEYVDIIFNLYKVGDLKKETFLKIKKDNLKFLRVLYCDYIFLKKKCSYDLSGYKDSLNVFYSVRQIKSAVPFIMIKKAFNKIKRIFCGR